MKFYVYEHWRPDTDTCFYVGKGKGRRAFTKHGRERNERYARIVRKLSRLGMCVEVRMVQSGLSESAAFSLEKERIAFWRSSGVKIANIAGGGQGTSGVKYSKARRAMISEWARNLRHTDETKAIMREIALARPSMSDKQRRKIAKAVRNLWADPEYREKVTKAHLNRAPISDEARARLVAGQRARGKTRPESHKSAISASIKAWHAKRRAEREGAH